MKKPGWLKVVFRELSDKWQIPSFVVSMLLIAIALYLIISSGSKGKSTEDYVSICQKFYDKGQFVESAKLAAVLLAEDKVNPAQKTELNSLLAKILYHKEKSLEKHNIKRINSIIHYLGLVLDDRELKPDENLILSDVYWWNKNPVQAVKHLDAALDGGAHDRIKILKRILTLLPHTGKDIKKEYTRRLNQLLKEPGLSESDLAWAIDLKTERLFNEGKYGKAIALIKKTLGKIHAEKNKLQLRYSLAFGEYHEGHLDKVEAELRDISSRLPSQGELDAKVSLLLGDICLDGDRPEEAISFFNHDIHAYPLSDYHLASLCGKARSEVVLKRFLDARRDYENCLRLLKQLGPNRLVTKDEVLRMVEKNSKQLFDDGEIKDALLYAHLQLANIDKDDILSRNILLARTGTWHQKLAIRLSKRLSQVTDAKLSQKLRKEISENYLQSGEHYLLLSQSPGLLYRDAARSLWEAIICFNKAGDSEKSIKNLKQFIHDWPNDAHIPEALYRLAQFYRSQNRLDLARDNYLRLSKEFHRTPWGLKSLVPLAETYIAMGQKTFGKAEQILTDMVDDTSKQELFTPKSEEFRNAVFLLGKLYYYQGKFELAVARFEEALQRYPKARQVPESRFIIAQCYRKIAAKFHKEYTTTTDRVLKNRLLRSWRMNILRGKDLYLAAISSFESRTDLTPIEKTYLQLSYIYYADALYDLGDYPESIRAYEKVIDKYEKSTIALASYVQITNAYQKLGQWSKIKAVIERMKWLIKQLPDNAFDSKFHYFTRKDWEDWISWNYKSGLLEYKDREALAQK